MITRCHKPTSKDFPRYGGRGVVVCDEWRFNKLAFFSWSEENGYADHLTIDRIKSEGIYEPDNCRWTTKAVQQANKRTVLHLVAFGETKRIAEWVEDPRCKVSEHALRTRLKRGWSLERAMTQERHHIGVAPNKRS